MRRLVIVPALLILAGCTPPKVMPEAYGPRPTEAEARSAVEAWTRQALKDPYSAVIGEVRVGSRASGYNGIRDGGWTHGWEVWFQVNAKNSFGAYIGHRTYCILWSHGNFYWKPNPLKTTEGGKMF